ncbi:MAG TPA: helix-turn-helix domain-containing protein [Methylomirabilota bacterium]|nr:helix-turn-helix domain-containing protein [Methylomirabilota bacterium]
MKGYGQFCPVAVACEIVAERWTPLILRELLAGSTRFNQIRQGLPLISRALLAQRLHLLEETGVIQSHARAAGRGREYRLTRAGEALRSIVDGLGAWGQHYAATQFSPENLDVGLLMFNIKRRVDLSRLPKPRVVVRFELRGVPARCRNMRTTWLVLEPTGVDVCIKDPGFPVDLVLQADMATLARVWAGHVTFAQGARTGGLRLEGPRELVHAFPGWLKLSHFAAVLRSAHAS